MPHGDELSGKSSRSVIPLFEPAHLSVKKKIVRPRDDFCGLNLPIGNRPAPPEVPIDRESLLVKTVMNEADMKEVRDRDEAYEKSDADEYGPDNLEQNSLLISGRSRSRLVYRLFPKL
jgi:hypothetical protein